MRIIYYLNLALISVCFTINSNAQINPWTAVNTQSLPNGVSTNHYAPDAYLLHSLDVQQLEQALAQAPNRESGQLSNVQVLFPDTEGNMLRFIVYKAPVLAPDLQSQYPEINTYLGINAQGVRARFSLTPQGFKNMVIYPDRTMYFSQPVAKGSDIYITYHRGIQRAQKSFTCETEVENKTGKSTLEPTPKDANDQTLRTLRIAISTTGEYTQFWGDNDNSNGTNQDDAFAEVVSTINRNNEIYETEIAATFSLVSNTSLVFPNPSTDPYTGSFNNQLQSTLTTFFGEANYDIGHLFHYNINGNNGNAGCIGCVCVNNQKGRGWSAHTFLDNDGGPYLSDFFDVDYVAHEVGHQMGANHTWAFNTEGTGVNSEPGSGTTIMSYAGITGVNNVAEHSDPYFHYHSINQISNTLAVRTCWVGTPIANNPPVADAGADFTIPIGTAYVLEGSATDPDAGDVIYYTWEQLNSGQSNTNNFGPNLATASINRSLPPSTSPVRFIPNLNRVVAGQLTETNPNINSDWETVSNVGRTLIWGLVARDRSATATGQTPQNSFDTMSITVDANAGPFVVTSHTTSETLNVGETFNLTWDVANTDLSPVNTTAVDVFLSLDGGFTYPVTIATGIPNTGSAAVSIPVGTAETTTGRIMVRGSNNIFYAINTADLVVQNIEFSLSFTEDTQNVCGNDTSYNFLYNTFAGFNEVASFSASGNPTGTTVTFTPSTAQADGTAVNMNVDFIAAVPVGNYTITISVVTASVTRTFDVSYNVFDSSINPVVISAPQNGDIVEISPVLSWQNDPNVSDYLVQIATDSSFNTIIDSANLSTNSYQPTLDPNVDYWWRVSGTNICGTNSGFTNGFFTTENFLCVTEPSTDTPVTILSNTTNGNNVFTSTIVFQDDMIISDVNVFVDISHTWVDDVNLTLTGPNGVTITLMSNSCANRNDIFATYDDDGGAIPCSTTPPTVNGIVAPQQPLSTFNNISPLGQWTLTVTDIFPQADGGSINAWSLEICGSGPTLSTEDFGINNISVFPNPNRGIFNVRLSDNSSYEASLFDITGRNIANYNLAELNNSLEIPHAKSGVYLLKIKNATAERTFKLIVE